MSKSTRATIATGAAVPPGLRRFLYLTAMLTGAAILVVEILGAKMLSPYIGTSHFVWTAQIAVTLLSLAAGYYFGGWMSDRTTDPARLYLCIAVAAAYLGLVLTVIEPIAYRCISINLALGSFLASAILFFVPLTLLAAEGPFLVKVLARSFNVVGSQVGRLSALGTLGSVMGTVLAGYVLVPYFPNSVTMLGTAFLLFVLVAIYFVVWGRPAKLPLALLAAAGLGFGALGVHRELTARLKNVDELYRANSNYGLMQVVQTRTVPRRFFLNDFLVQNTYDPVEKKSTSLFTYMLRYLPQAYHEELNDVLCIGLGVGIVPMELAREGVRVQAVEINPGVVKVGEKFFDLDPSQMDLFIEDGRYFVHRTKQKYDAVLLDAFLGDSSPSHLMTREAFTSMKNVLRPDGVLVINSFGDFKPGRNFFVSSLYKTLRDVFPSVAVHATGNGNVFFVASTQRELRMRPVSTADAHAEVAQAVAACLDSSPMPDLSAGRVLTDDFNPVEFHDARNREEHRRNLAAALRRL